ncbi:MAG: septum formation initiator family protein [Chloroflexi bacterium]|nr:septum formation initiator family protein [Chloroflexota bacterium]
MSQSTRKNSLSFPQLVGAAALALAIFILVVLAQRVTTTVVLWRQTQTLQAEIDAQHAESDRLEKRKRYVQTDEYIESVARRDMKLTKPGEVAVIGEPAPTAQPSSTPLPNGSWWNAPSGR